jgi:hypothetical protein
MRILFIVPYVPNLVRVRPYNLIRYLARQGHAITLATLYANAQEKADLEELRLIVEQVLAYPLPAWRSLMNVLGAIPGRAPLQAAYCWRPQLDKAIHQQLKAAPIPYDVIHVEHLRGVN